MALLFDVTPDELRLFLEEAEEHLQTLDTGLLHLERQGSDTTVVQNLFRAAHTLKGSAGALGHGPMATLTHRMESILDLLRNHQLAVSKPVIDVLLGSLDTLRRLNHQIETLEESDIDLAPIIAALDAIGQPTPAAGPANHPAADTSPLPPFPLSPDEQQALTIALANDHSLWAISLHLDTSTGLQAPRALQVLLELAGISQIIYADPNQDAIERSQVGDSQRLLIGSQCDAPLITDLLSGIGDVSQVIVTRYHPTDQSTAIAPPIGGATPEPTAAAVAAETPIGAGSAVTAPAKTIRMDVARLDKLVNLAGELVVDRTRLLQLGSVLANRYHDDPVIAYLVEAALHVGRITDELHEEVMKGRMQPIASLLTKFPRLVRDLAAKVDKQVQLVIEGQETELDRSVIEAIGDPLIHLIRNSVDHGLETPAERLAAGKPAEGRLLLQAQHADNHIQLILADDGRGIDPELIKTAAIRKELLSPAAADRLTPSEAINLIFTPGFSTAKTISDISGRGVGMDIVRANIEKLNGTIAIESIVGHGTTVTVRLPLTLAIISALLIEVANQIYAIPLGAVHEALRLSPPEIKSIQHQEAILLRGRVLPLMRLRHFFRLLTAEPDTPSDVFIVAVRCGTHDIGLMVDRLIGEQEIVIKPLGRLIGDTPGISGATILGDGGVALILDLPGLVKAA